MIYNSAMIRGSGGVTYHVENDQYNTFWPTEARPGQYVVNPSGEHRGSPFVFDETGTYMLARTSPRVDNIDDLPPKVREVLESAPSTLAPPMSANGYIFFIMPEENVKIITKS